MSSANRIYIAHDDLGVLKQIAQAIRSTLVNTHHLTLPGKRRFLDAFANGLGYENFSQLTQTSLGVKQTHTSIEKVIDANCDPLTAALLLVTNPAKRETASNIREAIHTAIPAIDLLIHHLTIQASQKYYFSQRYGFFEVGKPLNDTCRHRYEIEEIYVVGLSVRGLPDGLRIMVRHGDTIDLAQFIVSTWASDKHSYGVPDELIIHRSLVNHLPGIDALCEQYNVRLKIAEKSDRQHTAIANAVRKDYLHVERIGERPIMDLSLVNSQIAKYRDRYNLPPKQQSTTQTAEPGLKLSATV